MMLKKSLRKFPRQISTPLLSQRGGFPSQIRASSFSSPNQDDLKKSTPVKETVDIPQAPPAGSFRAYMELGRFHKPIGSYLLAWPCLWSIGMGTPINVFPDPFICGAFVAGSFLLRSGGCVINDLCDRDLDNKVERTKVRPLASGALSPAQAWAFLVANFGGGLGVLLYLDPSCFWIAMASMPLVFGYPLAKRYTHYPQFVLGSVFGWGSLMGYLAATAGVYNWSVMAPLYLGCWSWIVFYDTIYGHQDKRFDKQIGVKSTALTWGDNTKKVLPHLANMTALFWTLSGYYCGLNWAYYASVAAARAHMEWQTKTVDLDNPEDCGNKFKSNSHLAAIIFVGVILGKFDSLSLESLRGKKKTQEALEN